jgi:pimeloyl-ACP methyl ester carboxylesterase
MPYTTVNEVDHYYEWICDPDTSEVLETPSQHKPVMVFVHGWAGSARYWRTTARVMAARYDCLLYDLRGFGRSQAAPAPVMATDPTLGSLESFSEDLKALLDSFGFEQVFLNAHSLGGSVGLYFLDRYPDYVQKAILTCNGIFEYDQQAFEAFYRLGGYAVRFRPRWLGKIPLVPNFFMARFLNQPIPYAEKQAFLDDFLQADEATALGTMRAAVSKYATETMPKAFAALKVPTLLISGQYDKIIPAELGQRAAALNDHMQYALINNTGHFPMLEDPDTYLSTVVAFLDDL